MKFFFFPPSEIESLQNFLHVPNTLQLMGPVLSKWHFGVDKTKKVYVGSLKDDRILAEKLRFGYSARYGKREKVVADRIRKELDLLLIWGLQQLFL